MLARNDLADYLADNYGLCAVSPCKCLREGWRGRACPHWRPSGATDLDELAYAMRRMRAGLE